MMRVQLMSIVEGEEQWWEVRNTENGEVCSIQAQDFRSLRRKIQDVYGTSTAVRVFYLDDECDVVFVKRDRDLEDTLFVLPKKNKTAKAVESQVKEKIENEIQEVENRVADDEEKVGDEISENPQKRLKEQQKREKKIEMLSKRDEKLADQIDVLEEKIVALQQRKEQLTENKTQVRENLVDLKSQEDDIVDNKQEKEGIEEIQLSEEEEEEEEERDYGKPRSFGQSRKLENQRRNIERRLCNLEAKEKKSKKMMETEIILKKRLEEITERLVTEPKEEEEKDKMFMNKRKGKDGCRRYSSRSYGSKKKFFNSPPKERRRK